MAALGMGDDSLAAPRQSLLEVVQDRLAEKGMVRRSAAKHPLLL